MRFRTSRDATKVLFSIRGQTAAAPSQITPPIILLFRFRNRIERFIISTDCFSIVRSISAGEGCSGKELGKGVSSTTSSVRVLGREQKWLPPGQRRNKKASLSPYVGAQGGRSWFKRLQARMVLVAFWRYPVLAQNTPRFAADRVQYPRSQRRFRRIDVFLPLPGTEDN
jgi:hypothetical protein